MPAMRVRRAPPGRETSHQDAAAQPVPAALPRPLAAHGGSQGVPPHGQGAHALLHQSFWHITSASTRPSDNLHLSHVTLHQGSLATCFKHIIHHKKSLLYLNLHPFHTPELHLHVI